MQSALTCRNAGVAWYYATHVGREERATIAAHGSAWEFLSETEQFMPQPGTSGSEPLGSHLDMGS